MKTASSVSLLAMVLGWSSPLWAGPAQWGIAVNSGTKECAAFWAGDEFVHYSLKDGWQDYYPSDSDAGYGIATAFGRCSFVRGQERSCCDQLKLAFVTVAWPSSGGGGGSGCSIGGAHRPSRGGVTPLALALLLLLRRRSSVRSGSRSSVRSGSRTPAHDA